MIKTKLGNKAVAPIVSTLLLMLVMTLALSVALTFVQSNLIRRNAENDFNSAKAFMETIGLQIDDVAWIIGRTKTVQSSSTNGEINLVNRLLNYTIQVKNKGSTVYQVLASYEVGVLFFNIPLSKYYLDNEYYEEIVPTKTKTLVFNGTSATVFRVFALQKNPILGEPDFIRVITTPNIRYLPSSISTTIQKNFYVKLYLPNIILKTEPRTSQSLTLTGKNVKTFIAQNIESIIVTVSFPQKSLGYDNTFFHFPTLNQTITLPQGYDQTKVELFVSEIQVDFGI